MGIDIFAANFLKSEMRRGTAFGHTLTLGHQSIYMDQERYRAFMAALGRPILQPEYADDLFHALGATTLDVMDASDYEGANVVQDLNQPVDSSLHNRYDCVFDGGALEHVFNFPVALKSCMEMVKTGGHFIGVVPANNYCGHGFYQFSPELFYRALSPANGFMIEKLLFVYRDRWYSVRNPSEEKARIEMITSEPILLFVSAKRCEQKGVFEEWPQQLDYVNAWEADTLARESVQPKGGAKELLLKILPCFKRLQARWRIYKHCRECSPQNRARFAPVDIEAA